MLGLRMALNFSLLIKVRLSHICTGCLFLKVGVRDFALLRMWIIIKRHRNVLLSRRLNLNKLFVITYVFIHFTYIPQCLMKDIIWLNPSNVVF